MHKNMALYCFFTQISVIISAICRRGIVIVSKSIIKGYIMAFSGYLIWGILPIYWHNLSSVSSLKILMFRILFSALTLLIFVYAAKNTLFISFLKDKTIRKNLMITSALIAVNWGLFIYAVSSSHVLQASLGYYINPLISILLGVIFLKEKLDAPKIAAVFLAFAGVLYMTISLGEFPYISLVLAVSFGLYGYMKKKLHLDSYNSLLVETLLLSGIALIYAVYLAASGTSGLSEISSAEWILIALSGVVTCLPLILFNEGAKAIPLSSLGFLQYLAPTLMLLVGVLLYNEHFTKVHIISFALIWTGYFIYIFSLIISARRPEKNKSS